MGLKTYDMSEAELTLLTVKPSSIIVLVSILLGYSDP